MQVGTIPSVVTSVLATTPVMQLGTISSLACVLATHHLLQCKAQCPDGIPSGDLSLDAAYVAVIGTLRGSQI